MIKEGLIGLLESRRGQDASYIGCMKSGEVVAQEFVSHTTLLNSLIFALKPFLISVQGRAMVRARMVEVWGREIVSDLKILFTSLTLCSYYDVLKPYLSFVIFRYFRHAAGSLIILSKNLAQYININRLGSQTY